MVQSATTRGRKQWTMKNYYVLDKYVREQNLSFSSFSHAEITHISGPNYVVHKKGWDWEKQKSVIIPKQYVVMKPELAGVGEAQLQKKERSKINMK